MKRFLLPLFAAAISLQFGLTSNAASENQAGPVKLDAKGFTIVDETISHLKATKRGAAILFDSQENIPEKPVAEKIRIEGKTWQPVYINAWGEPSFYIDLGAFYKITDIGYMDMNGSPVVTVYEGSPFNWEEKGVLPTNYYNTYRVSHFEEAKPVRYLRVVSAGADTGINELGIYGVKVRDITEEDNALTGPKPAQSTQDNLTSGKKIGANAFCDDPYTALAALGNVREYYNWSWLTDENGKHWFNRVVNKDNYYKTLKSMGVSVIPCMQMICDALVEPGETMNQVKNTIPVKSGADTLDPMSYTMHSNAMYNFAARYGSNKNVDPSTLAVGNGDVQIGLGYLNAVESWNEQDKTWETKDSYFHPYEYAAMLSADYDGHEGSIPNAGVKTADPNFKLAMGGLAGGKDAVAYLNLMKNWFDHNRSDGQFACDIINYHYYITDTEAPEKSDYRKNIQEITAWVDENAPGRDVWLSEFDVVTDDKKVDGVDCHDNPEYAKTRADRLLRAFLVGEREGLDRMSMFMLRDEWSGVYYNSGLTTGKGDWDKKASWYYVACAEDTLKNADLVDISESNEVYLYTYKDRDTSEKIYAVWSPTADGSGVKDYTIPVGEFDKATKVTPMDGFKEGQKEMLPMQGGAVTLDVSETPVFVKVSNQDVQNDPQPQKKIEVQQLRLGEMNGSRESFTFDNTETLNLAAGEIPSADNFMLNQFYHLFDEQTADKTAATPWMKTRMAPSTEMSALSVHKDRAYPYDCILTFDDNYQLTYLGIYDSFSVGKMEIYDDVTGNLLFASKLDSYNTWVLMPVTPQQTGTNRIRIVKYDDAKLNELAFYGYPNDRRVGIDVPEVPGEIGEAVSDASALLAVDKLENGMLSAAQAGDKKLIQNAFQTLFDEQGLLPENNRSSLNRNTSFKTSFSKIWTNKLDFPYDSVVTLKERSQINGAAFLLGWGENTGKFEIYDNETDSLLYSGDLNGNGKLLYIDFETPVQTQSLRIVKCNSRTISEIGFYGSTFS